MRAIPPAEKTYKSPYVGSKAEGAIMNSTIKTGAFEFCASDWTLIQSSWAIVHEGDIIHEVESLVDVAKRRVLKTSVSGKPQHAIARLQEKAKEYLSNANKWAEIKKKEKEAHERYEEFRRDGEREEVLMLLKELEEDRLSIEADVPNQERKILVEILELDHFINLARDVNMCFPSLKEER
jgi:hypothetical protein